MKKTYLALAIAGMLMFSANTRAQSVDEIVAKHIEARGGLDKVHALKSLTMEALLIQNGVEVNLKFFAKHQEASKVEFTAMGQTGYNIVTKTEGWAFNPFSGGGSAEPLTDEQLKEGQAQLDLQGPLVDYKEKGNKVEFLGKENMQGYDYYKLKITLPSGRESTMYLNSDYLVAKVTSMASIGGSEQEITTEYSDYRKTPEGYMMSFKRSGPSGDITFEKVTINPEIDPAVFKPTE